MASLLERAAEILNRGRVPFALIGATAMAVHGTSRSTQDVDLLVTLEATLDPSLWGDIAGSGAEVEIRRGDVDDPLLGVVRLHQAIQSVDIVVGRGAWQADIVRRARLHEISGVRLPVADPADLVLLKLYAGGVQDRWDIVQLVAVDPGIPQVVEARLHPLPDSCRALWQSLKSEAFANR